MTKTRFFNYSSEWHAINAAMRYTKPITIIDGPKLPCFACKLRMWMLSLRIAASLMTPKQRGYFGNLGGPVGSSEE